MTTETKLQTLHNMAMSQIQLYATGLITLPELTKSIGEIGKALETLGSLNNLIDPSTGLRFGQM